MAVQIARFGLALVALASLQNGAIAAVQTQTDLVDRIVAIVGDTVVTQSEVVEYLLRLQTQAGIQLPTDPEELDQLMSEALRQKVDEVLVVLHANRDGVVVPPAQVEEAVETQLANIKRQFSTELEFQQALASMGSTAAEFRISLTEQARSELTAQKYLQMRLSELNPVPVSEEEVRERFEARKAMLGPKPATVSLKNIIITPGPSEDARLAAREKGQQALLQALSGADFALLAREYSDDEATRTQGGSLGWVRQSQLLTEFENKLFTMQVGEISDLVETSVGYHIIKLDRIRGAERQTRHILLRPEVTDADVDSARALATRVTRALRDGADPDSLATLYGDPQETSTLNQFPRDQLPTEYENALQGATEGDVIGPFNVPRSGVRGGKWAVVFVVALSPGGEWTYDDVSDNLRRQIEQERMLQQVVEDLHKKTYIEIREVSSFGVG